MSNCNDELLEFFSNEHYTYINQIFGDETIREIISEVFPNHKFYFGVEDTGEEFENSSHHILIEKKTNEPVCSVDNGYQNIYINKNDTLCQSYSLLTYFNKNIDPDQKQRQMDMITMYRTILSNHEFITKLDEVIHSENDTLWQDYTQANRKKEIYIHMDKTVILQKIIEVLDKWEDYGYWYFIGEGKCPKKRKIGGKKKVVKTKTAKKKTVKTKTISTHLHKLSANATATTRVLRSNAQKSKKNNN